MLGEFRGGRNHVQLFRAQCSSQGTEDYWIKQSILVQLDIKLTSRMKQTHGFQLQIKTQRCIYQIQTEWYTLRYPSCERERETVWEWLVKALWRHPALSLWQFTERLDYKQGFETWDIRLAMPQKGSWNKRRRYAVASLHKNQSSGATAHRFLPMSPKGETRIVDEVSHGINSR